MAYEVRATSVSRSRADVSIRDFTVIIDEPEKLGGTNAGPNPIELELASLAQTEDRYPVSDNLSHGTTIDVRIGA